MITPVSGSSRAAWTSGSMRMTKRSLCACVSSSSRAELSDSMTTDAMWASRSRETRAISRGSSRDPGSPDVAGRDAPPTGVESPPDAGESTQEGARGLVGEAIDEKQRAASDHVLGAVPGAKSRRALVFGCSLGVVC